MENLKPNEDSHNQSALSDDDKSPSPKITLFEKHEVVKLENVKLKERQEEPNLTKKQREAAGGPPDLTEQHFLSKEDSSKDLQHGESREKISPDSNAAPGSTNEQTGAADNQGTEEHCPVQKNSMNGEFWNRKNPVRNYQEMNTPADLIEEQTEATDIHAEEPGPQPHIQNDSVKRKHQTDESSLVNGQGSNSLADLNKEQTEASEIHAKEPGPQLHIQKNSASREFPNGENPGKNGEDNTPVDIVTEQIEATDIHAQEPGIQLNIHNDSVKDELPIEDSSEMNGQETKSPSNLREQNKDIVGLYGIPEENLEGLENNLKELPVTKSLENYPESEISNEDSTKVEYSLTEKDKIDNTPALTKCHHELCNASPKQRCLIPVLSFGEPLVLYDLYEDISEFQKNLPNSSKRFPPACSLYTGSVAKKDAFCTCPQLNKVQYPNACPTKFSIMQDSLLSLNRLEANVETAPQTFDDSYTGESDKTLVHLEGFTKEYCEEIFSKLETLGSYSYTDDSTAREPLYLDTPSSEISRPKFPVSTVLLDLNKTDEAHDTFTFSKLLASNFFSEKDDHDEVLRVRELFKNCPNYPFVSSQKRPRIRSSSSDGLFASESNRYVRLSPTDVVSSMKNHFEYLSSVRNELMRYSSSIKRDGPFMVRFIKKMASSALDALATIAEEMKEKVLVDIQFYNENYIIETEN